MCVATNAGGEAVAIGLPKCIDAGVASLLTDLPAVITFAIIEAGAFILSTLALSGSFLWHATLTSNSSEPQPHGQLSALGSIFDSAGAVAVLPRNVQSLTPQCTTAVGMDHSPTTLRSADPGLWPPEFYTPLRFPAAAALRQFRHAARLPIARGYGAGGRPSGGRGGPFRPLCVAARVQTR